MREESECDTAGEVTLRRFECLTLKFGPSDRIQVFIILVCWDMLNSWW